MTAARVVEVSVHIAAKPETVFPYFTDPGRYVQWMGIGAALEPVPGGCYRVVMRDGVEAAGALSALHHKPGLLKHPQVLADRRPRHLELRCDLSCRQLPVPHQFQDAQPPGPGDHLQRFHDGPLHRSARTGLTPANYFR